MSLLVPHFFTIDLLTLAAALFLGGIVICLPGYAMGWWLDLLHFRSQPPPARWSLSTLFGISMVPILLYLPFKLVSSHAMMAVLGVLVVAGFISIALQKGVPGWSEISRTSKIAVMVCILLGIAFLLDVTVHGCLYPSWSTVDQSARTAMIVALDRSQHLPAASPSYAPGHPTQLKYHYFFFLIGSAIVKLSAGVVPARIALSAITIWSGFALLATISVFIQFYGVSPDRERATNVAWFLLLVTGLDIIPVMGHMLFERIGGRPDFIYLPDVEWWNGAGNISGWLDTMVWAPHHLASMIACLLGCLILWETREQRGWRQGASVFAAALAFASATGLSILLVIVFGTFLLLVALELLLNHPRQAIPLLAAGLIGLALASPFLLEMRPSPDQPNPMVSAIMLRQFQPLTDLYLALGVKSLWAWNLSYLALLPINYFLELGVFFLAGILWLLDRRSRNSPPDIRDHLTGGLLAITLLLTCFFRFGVSFSNDFGGRGILPAQFVLLLWAAELGQRYWKADSSILQDCASTRRLAIALIVLGVASNVLGLVLLRGRVAFAEAGKAPLEMFSRYANEGERMAQLRSAYDWIRRNTAPDAVVQENPTLGQTFMQSQYSERSTAIYFPIDVLGEEKVDREYRVSFDLLAPLFETNASVHQMRTACAHLGIDYIIVQDNDPDWAAKNSYVWNDSPVAAFDRVRVFHCK
jgi:hypothetical protein